MQWLAWGAIALSGFNDGPVMDDVLLVTLIPHPHRA
jgi:hypothetical protein